ncbi:MAG: class II glutamine amidotransferase [Thaumarchaeota archaeon]|nr:class II glutamine amidotransferase [Nitrososphaerota archaeon]
MGESIGSLEMCGIAALLCKTQTSSDSQPLIGARLRDMLFTMRHRGTDSTGVNIVGQRFDADYLLRVFFSTGVQEPERIERALRKSVEESGGEVRSVDGSEYFYRIAFDYDGNMRTLSDRVLDVEGAEIHSIGRCSEIIKDVGDAAQLDKKHGISKIRGTHGIGHVRLATESQVDISHSHPFWAYPFPDIAVVHNGQLTNYHKLKREFEQRGFRFQTHNDSEVIAVYIAEKLSSGEKLNDVLHESLEDLDGTFTYVVSTDSGIGVAKDRWAAKPFVIFETEDLLGVASEEVALSGIFPGDLKRFDPQENQVLTWNVGLAPVIRERGIRRRSSRTRDGRC